MTKFGCELLDGHTVQAIKLRYLNKGIRDELRELCVQILEEWGNSRDKAEWYEVVEALRSINQHKLATEIEEAIIKQQPRKRPAPEEKDGGKTIFLTELKDM